MPHSKHHSKHGSSHGLLDKIPIVRGIKKIFGGGGHKGSHKAREHGEGKKIRQGKKYARILKTNALDKNQKKIIKRFMKPVKAERFEKPSLFKHARHFMRGAVENGPPESPLEETGTTFLQNALENGVPISEFEGPALGFLRNAMERGAPVSPVETAGQTYLQNLLGRTPEDQFSTFAAPFMRQFQEDIMPGIAERFAGAGALSGSGFQNAISQAGAGLSENLAALKGNLINQMLDRQLQGANIGLGYAQMPGQRLGQQIQAANAGFGYAQLPGQRFGQQLNAANTGLGYAQLPAQRFNQQFNYAQSAIPTSLIPQEMQREMDRYAAQQNFLRGSTVLGTPSTNSMIVPPQTKKPGFWGGAGPGLAGAGVGAGLGALLGGPMGALMGAGVGSGLGNTIAGRGGGGVNIPISFIPPSSSTSSFPIRQNYGPEGLLAS